MSDLFESLERIHTVDLSETMEDSYLNYAMSVICGRALPESRDGLKPVQRRILFEMGNMNLSPGRPYRKSARVVGSVMGKWHPHGDNAIYDALSRMSQPFSLRYPLVDGHGNFGSIDGDSPAAQRYTECRLSPIAMEMLAEVEQDTVDFAPNYDSSDEEPGLLPSRLPTLLMNGSMGVAVGVSTAVPPHNLTELLDGALTLLDNPETEVSDLMKIVKGPDFPTGGVIQGKAGIKSYMETGVGSVKVRAKVKIEPADGRKNAKIIITEIPYLVKKSNIVLQIHEAANKDRIRGIKAVRDESGRQGIRIVVEVSARRDPNLVLHLLFKHTSLSSSFPARMITLVDGAPRPMPLKESLFNYITHRSTVVKRRTAFELRKAEARAHIVEGLLVALKDIDAVIKIIKKSKDREKAKTNLAKELKISLLQSDAIVRMQLGTLTGLEVEKLQVEMNELQDSINWYNKILGEEKTLKKVLREEMEGWRDKYGDARRTKIDSREAGDEMVIQPELQVVVFTEKNYIKRIPLTDFKTWKRRGQGIKGITLQDKDKVKQLDLCWNTDELFMFTDYGKIYSIPVYDVIEGGRTAKGIPVQNYRKELQKEKVVCIRARKKEKESLLLLTEKGRVKRLAQKDVAKIMKPGKKVMRVDKGDRIVNALWVDGNDRVLTVTANGKASHLPASEIRVMGRTAGGVKAMTLETTKRGKVIDKIVDAGIVGLESKVSGSLDSIEKLDDGSSVVTIQPKGVSKFAGKIIDSEGSNDEFIVRIDTGLAPFPERKLHFPPRSKLLVDIGAKVKAFEEVVSLPIKHRNPVKHKIPKQMSLGVKMSKNKETIILEGDSLTSGDRVLFVTDKGLGKLMDAHLVRKTHRGSKGVKIYSIKTPKGSKRKGVGHLARCRAIGNEKEVGIATADGQIYKTKIDEISQQKRSSRGVIVITLKPGDQVADLAII